jgi:hypothetical protein
VLVCSYLNGCCVCVCGFFSVDYRWVSGCLYFIYLCVCMYVVYAYDRQRKKKQTTKKIFCLVVKYGKTTELDLSFFLFDGVIIYLYVCFFCVSVRVIFSFEKQHTPTVYKYEFFSMVK